MLTGTLSGFHVDKQTLAATQLWSNVYSSPGSAVLEVAARDPAENVHSQAKVSRGMSTFVYSSSLEHGHV